MLVDGYSVKGTRWVAFESASNPSVRSSVSLSYLSLWEYIKA